MRMSDQRYSAPQNQSSSGYLHRAFYNGIQLPSGVQLATVHFHTYDSGIAPSVDPHAVSSANLSLTFPESFSTPVPVRDYNNLYYGSDNLVNLSDGYGRSSYDIYRLPGNNNKRKQYTPKKRTISCPYEKALYPSIRYRNNQSVQLYSHEPSSSEVESQPIHSASSVPQSDVTNIEERKQYNVNVFSVMRFFRSLSTSDLSVLEMMEFKLNVFKKLLKIRQKRKSNEPFHLDRLSFSETSHSIHSTSLGLNADNPIEEAKQKLFASPFTINAYSENYFLDFVNALVPALSDLSDLEVLEFQKSVVQVLFKIKSKILQEKKVK